jgi:hypothetical protein
VGDWEAKMKRRLGRANGNWCEKVKGLLIGMLSKGSEWILTIASWFWLTLLVIVVLYPVARLYIAVEVFASLRAPPVGTYVTVSWTGFIPHVG